MIADARGLVGGALATKAARLVGPDEPVLIQGPAPRYVSRGGEKLAGALERFALDVEGARCLDAGSSTGGFTDALLQAGASSVVAVDVGRNQLHERLRDDPRVDSRERTDIRTIDRETLGGAVDVVVADLSLISTSRLVDVLVGALRDGGDLVVLVNPQFEAGREEVYRARGVIRDAEIWRRVLDEACGAIEAGGTAIMDVMVSPLRGAEGNVEFLVHAVRVDDAALRRARRAGGRSDLDAVVRTATEGTA